MDLRGCVPIGILRIQASIKSLDKKMRENVPDREWRLLLCRRRNTELRDIMPNKSIQHMGRSVDIQVRKNMQPETVPGPNNKAMRIQVPQHHSVIFRRQFDLELLEDLPQRYIRRVDQQHLRQTVPQRLLWSQQEVSQPMSSWKHSLRG